MDTYLGDGVYAQLQGQDLILYTSNGVQVTNTIVLEPTVLHALLKFLKVM